MADKYYLVSHEVDVDRLAPYSSVARPGLATTTADPYSRFDQQVDAIVFDAENLSGLRPLFVSFSMVPRSFGASQATLNWCLFTENAATAFALMQGGRVSEHEWPEPVAGLGEEELLVKFFEVVVTQFW